MLSAIARACSSSKALEILRNSKSNATKSNPVELQSLLDMVGSLSLNHFGEVSESRKMSSILPDSLIELEKWHPLKTPFGFDFSLFPTKATRDSLDKVVNNGKSEYLSNMLTVYDDPEQRFVMQVFFLPKGCVMPLHDHPRMAVISKVLLGSIDITSYSFKSASDSPKSSLRQTFSKRSLAREVIPSGRSTISFDDQDASLSILLPEVGNLHAMRALDHTLFFDILTPPYSPPAIDCTYYALQRISSESGESVGKENGPDSIHSLYPTNSTSDSFFATPYQPEWFSCFEKAYRGTPISL